MSFASIPQDPLLQASLGPATATVLGASGLRLNGLTSFHLDEGPDYAWLNIYRTLADARQLEITREREPAEVALENGAVTIRWSPCDEVQGDLAATYRVVPEETAIDATFSFTAGGFACPGNPKTASESSLSSPGFFPRAFGFGFGVGFAALKTSSLSNS